METFGKQGGTPGGNVFGASATVFGDFVRTHEQGHSRHRGGDATGGVVVLPPQVGLDLVDSGLAHAALTTSSAFFLFGPGVTAGFGVPDVPSGGMKTGIGLSGSSGDLVAKSYSSTAIGTEVLRQSSTLLKPQVAVAFAGILSAPQITANQNDYAPTGLDAATTIRLYSDASRDVTGLAAASVNGKFLLVHNVGSFDIVLKDEDTGSSAFNRFALPDGDVTLTADMLVVMQYDQGSLRWRIVSGGGGGAAAGSFWTYTAQSTNYAAGNREFVDMDATGAVRTVTLPTAVLAAGRHIAVRKSDGSANKVTVATTGGQTINGAATFDITVQYGSYEFVSDGANWMIT